MDDKPNPFSKSIKLRPGGPIQLLNYMGFEPNEPGAILLEEPALNILRKIEEPISVIAIVGSYRRGKSYFANTILGRHNGFKLGSSVEGCTKGIDMWDTPFLYEGRRVVVLDCEGIDDPKQEVPWANKLFILCLAISSTFIFNINGVVGRDDVGKLCLMTDIASHIQPPRGSKFSPNLVVLLRDFQYDDPPDFVEYFLNQLSEANRDAAEGVKEFFGKFKVHAIPHPGIHKEKMKDMGNIETKLLDSIFVRKIEKAVDDIFRTLPPKYIEKSKMSGAAFAKYLEDCVFQMNSEENNLPLSIPSAYETTTNYVAQKVHETCLKDYEELMNKRMSITTLPISWNVFDRIHIDIFETVMEKFTKKVIGSAERIRSSQKVFYERILNSKEQFYRTNSEAMYNYNKEWAFKLWEEYVRIGLVGTNLFSFHAFEEAINMFEQVYGTVVIPGVEAGQVLIDFKEHQYKYAVETLKYNGAINETFADEILAHQQLEQEYYNLVKKEKQLQMEFFNYKNEKEKTQQHLEEKIKNMEECSRNQNPDNDYDLLFELKQNRNLLYEFKEEIKEEFKELKDREKKEKEKKDDFWRKAGELIDKALKIKSLASVIIGFM